MVAIRKCSGFNFMHARLGFQCYLVQAENDGSSAISIKQHFSIDSTDAVTQIDLSNLQGPKASFVR
jgi:hypothetical protein